MAIQVTFYTLSGKFASVRKETFPSSTEALEAAKRYATPAGYTKIKIVEDNDLDGIRIVGTTPKGRAGRNIAIADWSDADMGES